MTNAAAASDGLRARKRAATHASIERTAIALALEHGYDNVTVEMICDASGVSPRTFFNYFGSKERVILGEASSMTEEDARAFVSGRGSDIVLELLTAMAAPLIAEENDPVLLRSRFLLITTTPVLLGRQMEWVAAEENRLIELVLDRFRAAGRQTDDLRDEAGMVVALAFAALRFTLQRLFTDGGDPDGRDAVMGQDHLDRAVVLAARVLSPACTDPPDAPAPDRGLPEDLHRR